MSRKSLLKGFSSTLKLKLTVELTLRRPEERTHFRPGQMGDQRAQFAHGVAALRRAVQVGAGRGASSGIRAPYSAVHLRQAYPRLSVSR